MKFNSELKKNQFEAQKGLVKSLKHKKDEL